MGLINTIFKNNIIKGIGMFFGTSLILGGIMIAILWLVFYNFK